MPVVVADVGLLGLSACAPRDWTLRFYDGRQLSAEQLADADALLVRSTLQLQVDALPPSVQFIGTATIGTDHLPLADLSARGISVASAPGCNAFAVTDYVLSSILDWAKWRQRPLDALTVGVVGVGHVGGLLLRRLEALGLRTLGSDRPRADAGTFPEHVPIDKLLAEADVVSVHVPLHHHPVYATAPLWSPAQWQALKPDALLINAARGCIFSEEDLLRFPGDLVLDVFPSEPFISEALLAHCWRVSPHIAGHSAEGKWQGTAAIVEALCAFWGHSPCAVDVEAICQTAAGMPPTGSTQWVRIAHACPLHPVDRQLRDALRDCPDAARAECFDRVRKSYPLRRESRL